MKPRWAVPGCFVLLLTLAFVTVTAGESMAKPRLGVLGVSATRSTWATDYVHNLITHDVTTLGRFEVVERSQINAILREQRFQSSGAIDEETAVRIGRILGIDVGVIASVETMQSTYRDQYWWAETAVLVKFIDVESGRLVSTQRMPGSASGDSSQEALRRAFDRSFGGRFQNRVAALFSLDAVVVEVEGTGVRGDTVFLSIGRNQGVKAGVEFEVHRPEVTALAGVELSEQDVFTRSIGAVRVADATAEFSRARVIQSTESIQPGDWVVEKVPARSAEESREGALRMLLLALVLAYALGQQ